MKKLFKKNQIIITALALMIAAAGYLSYTYSGIGDGGLTETNADLTEEDYDIVYDETLTDAEIFTEEEYDTSESEASEDGASGSQAQDGEADGQAQDGETDGQSQDGETDGQSQDGEADGQAQDGETDGQSQDTGSAGEEGKKKADDGEINNPGETVLTSSDASNIDLAVEAKLNREQVRSQNKENLMEVINSPALSDAEKQAAVDKMVALTDIAQRESDAELLLEAKGFTDVVVNITDDTADVVLDMGDVTDAKRAQIEDIVKRKTKIPAENFVITPITEGKEK